MPARCRPRSEGIDVYTPTYRNDGGRGKVKNVIYLIGDGMGLAHVSMLAVEGGYAPTAFDRAQGIALISTYSANNRVTDSAAAGISLLLR